MNSARQTCCPVSSHVSFIKHLLSDSLLRLDYLDNADLIITPDCNDIMLSCLSHVRRIGPLIGELTHMDIRGHRAGKYRHLDMGRAKTEHLSQLRFKMSGFVYRAGDKGHVTPQPSLLTVWFMFIQNPTLVAEQ